MPKRNLLQHVPNLFTLGNLFLGCLGIVYAFNDHIFPLQVNEPDSEMANVAIIFGFNSRLYLSSFMIFGAAVLDFLDGFAARLLHAHSPIGGQLDSLADGVTFGVLPACIYFQLLNGAYHLEPNAFFIPLTWLLPAFLIALAAAYRLAKFNVDERQHDGFIGLPSPANALFAATLPLIVFTNAYDLSLLVLNKWFLYGCILIFSWLMVAEIPMFSLKIKSLSWKGNRFLYLFLGAALITIVLLKYTGIALIIILYIVICVVQRFTGKKPKSEIVNSEST